MRELSNEMKMSKLRMKMMAILLLVVVPTLLLLVAGAVEIITEPQEDFNIMLYAMLVIAVVSPLVVFIIEPMEVKKHKKNDPTFLKRAKLYATLSLIKFSLAESAFIFGMVSYLLSGKLDYMPYFYIIGIVWSYIFWPRESSLENFMKKVEDHAPSQ